MISRLKKFWSNSDGNALVVVGASLPLLIGLAGIATDTIQWALWKRQLQRTADSAAIAAVYGMIGGQTRDAAVNRDIFHNNRVSTALVPTYLTPAAPFATDANAVRLRLTYSKALTFSAYFMPTPPLITAEATATVVPAGDYCVVSLENEAVTGINATGSTSVNLGCGMITNSPDDQAAVATGSSSVTASPMAAVGQIPASNNWGTGTVLQPFTLAQADPYASLNAPTPTGICDDLTVQPNNNIQGNSHPLAANDATGKVVMQPGCYGDITLKGDVILQPGTYILDAGSLDIQSGANVSCTGCTFVLTDRTTATPSSTIGTISINGGAILNLSAPNSTTDPFNGVLFYQDRRAPVDNAITINGGSNWTVSGAMYFPRAHLTFTGSSSMTTNCLLIASKKVEFKGNNGIDNNCPNEWLTNWRGRRVRLVA